MYIIGFLINPIAGMGGAVGLKGTDGLYDEAVMRGALPGAMKRALHTLSLIKESDCRIITCSGPMGGDAVKQAGIEEYDVVYTCPKITSARDTKEACRRFIEAGADLILFCGGDGTARDVFDIVQDRVPILGIPAGVKMYSSVFTTSPGAAADVIHSLCLPGKGSGEEIPLRDTEVIDVDEEAYRHGELRIHCYGFARSPYIPGLVQSAKQVFEESEEERAKRGISRFMSEVIMGTPEILYILGPGTTTGAIARQCGITKTLLGFDAVMGCCLVQSDVNENDILRLLEKEGRVRLVISVIGAQGSVLGRGTQQLSARVVRRIGVGNILVVATPHKLQETPFLFFDTGDSELDRSFGEYITVISGYRVAQRKAVASTAGSSCDTKR